MQVLIDAQRRLDVLLSEIRRLQEVEFPYTQSREVLGQIADLFGGLRDGLKQYDKYSDSRIVAERCSRSLSFLMQYLPLLGFILRSTNVRNAFEVYHPLRRLAGAVLEPDTPPGSRKTKLLLSSEWTYSPLTYTEIPQLPGVVLIGMPAHESSNPLLIPLAGHELGHSLWVKNRTAFWKQLPPTIMEAMVGTITSGWSSRAYSSYFQQVTSPSALRDNLDAVEVLEQAKTMTMRQAEESFCDFVGLRIFGESYLHAFAYLLAPRWDGRRSLLYPNLVTRASNLIEAARKFGVTAPPKYAAMFNDLERPERRDLEMFLCDIADAALRAVVPGLIDVCFNQVLPNGTGMTPDDETDEILNKFERVMPHDGVKSLSGILNAGWRAFRDPLLWSQYVELRESRDTVLNELILKNIEILEIRQIQLESIDA